MAVVSYTSDRAMKFTVTGMSASDSSQPLKMYGGAGVVLDVQILSGGGTGFNSGTMTIQVSNDNSNWATAKDTQGNDATATAAGHIEISTAARWIRALSDASIGDVDVIFNFG